MIMNKPHVVSFSGGRTSAYLVHLMEQKRKNEGWDVEYVFSDTGAEHPKTYQFIKQIVKTWKIDLTCLQPVYSHTRGVGVTYKKVAFDSLRWDLSRIQDHAKIYGNFTINRPHCTSRMKSDCQDKYKRDKYGAGNFYQWFGIRIDEPARLKFFNVTNDFFKDENTNPNNIRYLAEISDFEKTDVLHWWSQQGFDLDLPEHLGNCVFCIKKSCKKIALAARDEPLLFEQWKNAVSGSHVRLMPSDKMGVGHIYRGWLTPDLVVEQFKQVADADLEKSIYESKKENVGQCSESCEAFNDQLNLLDKL